MCGRGIWKLWDQCSNNICIYTIANNESYLMWELTRQAKTGNLYIYTKCRYVLGNDVITLPTVEATTNQITDIALQLLKAAVPIMHWFALSLVNKTWLIHYYKVMYLYYSYYAWLYGLLCTVCLRSCATYNYFSLFPIWRYTTELDDCVVLHTATPGW